MTLYSPKILDHYKKTRNSGKPGSFTSKAEELNTSCGDRVTVYLNIKDGKIVSINHETDGCVIAIASASMLSEKLRGKNIEEVLKLIEGDLGKILEIELTPSRTKCALLPLLAVQKALL